MAKRDDKQKQQNTDDIVLDESLENEEESKLQEDFDTLKTSFDDLQNQLKRAVADYQNLERRVSEGRSELTAWAANNLLQKMLPVLDHLEQAMSGAAETSETSGWFKGVEMAVKEFKRILAEEGLEQIEADGQFDPSLHEAVDTVSGEDGKIMKVLQSGYKINGKVLRPVRVVVGKES
jgi:molecular chaperone GrpE